MVEWKGKVSRESSGGKAARLGGLESLEVPNFFVVTRDEVQEVVGDSRSPEEILNGQVPEQVEKKLNSAYAEIGMSSEVRNASGKARDLVGGQRENQRVSVRVSGDRKGVFDYRLNVGASDLDEALKQVVASYYRVETGHDYPAVIVQKMVEPGFTGAAISNYLGGYTLVEAVEGMGVSIERGITRPAVFLIQDGEILERNVPRQQVKVTRNQMTGSHEKKKAPVEAPFDSEELARLSRKLEEEEASVKFVYKRGTFYVVDAFEPGNSSPFESVDTGLEAVRASEGEIEGTVGGEITYTDETVPPDSYQEAMISRRGGYTSTDSQLARNRDRPAIVNASFELEQGQQLSIGSKQVTPGDGLDMEQESKTTSSRDVPSTASEVLPVNTGDGVYLSPPFSGRYNVTDRQAPGTRIPRSGYLSSCSEVFGFDGDRAVLDARKIRWEGLEAAVEYLEADLKLLVLEQPDPDVIYRAIESGFDIFASPRPGELEKVVERQERRFIIQRLREL